jgi:hypothetical protein
MLLALLFRAVRAVTLDDIAIGVFSSAECFETRILPMARTWALLAPQVDVYIERNVSSSLWRGLLRRPRAGLVFHVQAWEPLELYGSRFETSWNWGQFRHLHAIADLWERYPNRSFYLLCDDDTFLIPANLLRLANAVDSESFHVYGKCFMAVEFVDRFSRLDGTAFTHGGAGALITGALMRAVGPHLRRCARAFAIPNIGSDIRLAVCIARLPGRPLWNADVHVPTQGFNSEVPDAEAELMSPGLQYSVHKVTERLADHVFAQVVTRVDDATYLDWSPVIYRLVKIDAGGAGRSYMGVFGYLLCVEVPVSLSMKAIGGFVKCAEAWADFVQKYVMGFELFVKCNNQLEEGEIAYFGEPPPPHFGVIVQVRSPALSEFARPSQDTAEPRLTYEEGSVL